MAEADLEFTSIRVGLLGDGAVENHLSVTLLRGSNLILIVWPLSELLDLKKKLNYQMIKK